MTPDDEAALAELLELPDDAEPIHGVVWGPVLEDHTPTPETITAKMRENGLEDPETTTVVGERPASSPLRPDRSFVVRRGRYCGSFGVGLGIAGEPTDAREPIDGRDCPKSAPPVDRLLSAG